MNELKLQSYKGTVKYRRKMDNSTLLVNDNLCSSACLLPPQGLEEAISVIVDAWLMARTGLDLVGMSWN